MLLTSHDQPLISNVPFCSVHVCRKQKGTVAGHSLGTPGDSAQAFDTGARRAFLEARAVLVRIGNLPFWKTAPRRLWLQVCSYVWGSGRQWTPPTITELAAEVLIWMIGCSPPLMDSGLELPLRERVRSEVVHCCSFCGLHQYCLPIGSHFLF